MIDFLKLKEIITGNKSFLLTTHVNPDADAIGSEIALYWILKELGKNIKIINHSITPYNLEFLDTDKVIEKYDEKKHKHVFNEIDVIVALDFNRADRTVSMQEAVKIFSKTKICIDHHLDPDDFTDYYFIDETYCATGHIIYDLIKKTGITELKYETAYPIYAAIMTDTGSFRFERTTPEIHRIAAELLEFNVVPNEVFDKLYDQSRFSKIKLLGAALESLQLYGKEKQIGFITLEKDIFKKLKAVESDTENFVNFTLSVEGVKIGLMFIELKEGFKVSFRSKGTVPVNKLAGEFGGGGHLNAAGARIRDGILKDYLPKILYAAEEYLKKNNGTE